MFPGDTTDARLQRWLDQLGLQGNPFAHGNAERDPDLPGYFVDIGQFDDLLRVTEPCLVFAGRGCGKTAQRRMLAAQCRPELAESQWLAVHYTYTGFEHALALAGDDVTQLRPIHHVKALIRHGLLALLEAARRDADLNATLQRPDIAWRLAAQTACFAPHLAPGAAVAGTFPFDAFSAPEHLAGFADLVRACGISHAIFLIDGLDEFSLTANDPMQLAGFLAPLLGTMALIECPGAAFKFFLPQILETVLRSCSWFRPDRLRLMHITWDEKDLRALIGQRLAFFSRSGSRTYTQLGELCCTELAGRADRELIHMAAGQPRGALALADRLLRLHCRMPIPRRLIAVETWEEAKAEWMILAADFRPPISVVGEQSGAQLSEAAPIPPISTLPPLLVDEQAGRVWLGAREITAEINAQDYRVLVCLHRNREEVCSKDLLVAQAWPDAAQGAGVTDQAIAAAIARLRKKLEQASPEHGYIETIKARGYRLHPEGFASH